MRVLVCHNFYQQPGGEDQVFHAEVKLLKAAGHSVREFTVHNDSIEQLGKMTVMKRSIWNAESAKQVSQILREFEPAVMHCHNIFPLLSPSIYYAAAAAGVAVVQTLHNYRLMCPGTLLLRNGKVCESCLDKASLWPAVLHRCYRDSTIASAFVAGMLLHHRRKKTWSKVVDRYIALTQLSKDKFVQGGFDPNQLVVKPNFLASDPGARPGKPQQCVFVGRLSGEKGIVTLLEAWKKISAPINLKIVGDGPLAESVKEAASRDSRIQWLGQKSLEEVCQLIGDASCLIMPSIWYETFGRTIIEAFSVGTHVIASRLGAMSELVEEGATGSLFESGSSDSLAGVVNNFFSRQALGQWDRSLPRQKFLQSYSAEKNYPQLMAVYEQAIAIRAQKSQKSQKPQSRSAERVS